MIGLMQGSQGKQSTRSTRISWLVWRVGGLARLCGQSPIGLDVPGLRGSDWLPTETFGNYSNSESMRLGHFCPNAQCPSNYLAYSPSTPPRPRRTHTSPREISLPRRQSSSSADSSMGCSHLHTSSTSLRLWKKLDGDCEAYIAPHIFSWLMVEIRVQMHWSGAYDGFGTGSLDRDRMEMGCLVKHLRAQGQAEDHGLSFGLRLKTIWIQGWRRSF